jgi:hypothetical protein
MAFGGGQLAQGSFYGNRPEEKTTYQRNVGFLQDTRSWIILPRHLSVLVSKDGKRWTQAFAATHDHDPKEMEPFTFELGEQLKHHQKIRYIRVVAENFGTLPDWHPGSGHPAFIFVDEVLVR